MHFRTTPYISPAMWANAAAIEIESYMNGVDYGDNFVNGLAYELLEKSREKQNPFPAFDLLLYHSLIWPNLYEARNKGSEDVRLHLNLLSKDLKCFREVSREKQTELRDVCLQLSRLEMREESRYRFGGRMGLVA